MTTCTHRIVNRTKGSLLSEGVPAVNGTFEHLTVLRVLIEGLADSNKRGLWLTEVQGIPSVPRISPFDLIYVDSQQRVVEAVELLPAGEQPPFREPAVSALVLPFQTISATETQVGDQLVIDAPAEPVSALEAEPDAAPAAHAEPAPPVTVPVASPAVSFAAVSSAALPVPPLPRPVLTVHEVVLPPASVPAPPQAAAPGAPPPSSPASPPAPSYNVKKHKGPRARKARAAALRAQNAQKARESAASLRQRRAEAYMTAATAPSLAPAPAPPPASSQISAPPPPAAELSSVQAPAPAPAPVPRAAVAPAAANKVPRRGRFMALVQRVLRWLNPNAVDVEQRGSIRMPAQDLVAYVGPEGEQKQLPVGNISSSGVYLHTDERWEPGSTVSMILQRSGPPAESPEQRVELEASTVRHGKDGVGLAFSLPQGMHLDLWEAAVRGHNAQTGPDYIVYEMRMAQALGLIRSICPEAVEQATQMLRKDFSSVRLRDALRLLQVAEKMLARRSNLYSLRAPARLVLRILEVGSWAGEDWTQELWAGLLATGCSPGAVDQTNTELAELLSQLAPVHLRILELASRRHHENPGQPGFTLREITRLLDLSNLTKTLRSVGEMAERGLMTPARRPAADPDDENARTTVTALGLQLHARCHGEPA